MIFTTNCFADYIVRQATNEDSVNIVKILTEAAIWLREKGVNQWSYLREGNENKEIEAAITMGNTFIVEDRNGNLLATFNLASEQNDWDKELWGDNSNEFLYLHRLAVARDQHNKGIGTKLMNWMTESTPAIIRLDCVAHNQVLNTFYQDVGFNYVGSHDMGGELFSKYERS